MYILSFRKAVSLAFCLCVSSVWISVSAAALRTSASPNERNRRMCAALLGNQPHRGSVVGSSAFIILRVSLIKKARDYYRVDACSESSSTSSSGCLALRASWFLSRCVAVTQDPARAQTPRRRTMMCRCAAENRSSWKTFYSPVKCACLAYFPKTSRCLMFPGAGMS